MSSDLDFEYTIQVINTNVEFPVQIELYDEIDNLILSNDVQTILGRIAEEDLYYIRISTEDDNYINAQTDINIQIDSWQMINS